MRARQVWCNWEQLSIQNPIICGRQEELYYGAQRRDQIDFETIWCLSLQDRRCSLAFITGPRKTYSNIIARRVQYIADSE